MKPKKTYFRKGSGTADNLPALGSPERTCLERYWATGEHAFWLAQRLNEAGQSPAGIKRKRWGAEAAQRVIDIWGHVRATQVATEVA